MHNDRTAKLRRRGVALTNTRSQLQAWKDAKTDDQVLSLMSTKNIKALGESYNSAELQSVRKYKIKNAETQIEILEKRT